MEILPGYYSQDMFRYLRNAQHTYLLRMHLYKNLQAAPGEFISKNKQHNEQRHFEL